MSEISIVGLDLAKNVFQVHAVDASGRVVLRRQLRRGAVEKFFAQLPPCTVGMEACGSAHHWARVIGGYGHLLARRPYKVVMVALAAKTARILWAMLVKGEAYRNRASASAAAC